MFSIFHKKPLLIKQTLRDFIMKSTNESIKRQIEYKRKTNMSNFIIKYQDENPKPPNDSIVFYVVFFLSLSSVFYYSYMNKNK